MYTYTYLNKLNKRNKMDLLLKISYFKIVILTIIVFAIIDKFFFEKRREKGREKGREIDFIKYNIALLILFLLDFLISK